LRRLNDSLDAPLAHLNAGNAPGPDP